VDAGRVLVLEVGVMGGREREGGLPCELLGLDIEVGLDALCELGLNSGAIGGGGDAGLAAGERLGVGGWRGSCESCSDQAEDSEGLHICGDVG